MGKVAGKYGPGLEPVVPRLGVTPVFEVPPGPARIPQGCVGGQGTPLGSVCDGEKGSTLPCSCVADAGEGSGW